MPAATVVAAVLAMLLLSGCAVVGAAARVTGSVASTTVDVTGDIVGGAVRTVTGGGDDKDRD